MSKGALESAKRLNRWNLATAKRQAAGDTSLDSDTISMRIRDVTFSIQKRLTDAELVGSERHWRQILREAGAKVVFDEVVFKK